MEMKKEYIKPEAEMMKFVESEEIMTVRSFESTDFKNFDLGVDPDPFV